MRFFFSLFLICPLVFGGNHFSPNGPVAIWDTTTAAGILNGNGNWNNTSALWNYDRNGVANSPFCQGCKVQFGRAAAGGAGGTVTVTGNQRVASWNFINPGGNYVLNGGTIECAGDASCTYNTDITALISSLISGNKKLIKTGSQALNLTGDNPFTGIIDINGGTLGLGTPNFNTYRGSQININGPTTLNVYQNGGVARYDFPAMTYNFNDVGGGTISTGAGLNWVQQGVWTFTTNGGLKNTVSGSSAVNMNTVGAGGVIFNTARGTDATSDLDFGIGLSNTADNGVTKNGSGFAKISGAITSTGPTTINDDGKLILTDGTGNFNTSIAVGANATLEFTTAAAGLDAWRIGSDNTKRLTGTGTVIKTGAGWTMFLEGYMTDFAGPIEIKEGTLGSAFTTGIFGKNASTMTVDVAAGARFDLRGAGANAAKIDKLTGTGIVGNTWNVAATLTVGTNNSTSTFDGVIKGAGGGAVNTTDDGAVINLAKVGTGAFELTGANTYQGTTTISNGEFKITSSGKIGNGAYTGAVSIAAGKIFHYASTSDQSMSGIISGAGKIKKEGTGNLTLSGVNTYTGTPTEVLEGTLTAITTPSAFQGEIAISAGATATLNVTAAQTYANKFSGAGTLKVIAGGTGSTNSILSGDLSGLTGILDVFPNGGTGGKANITTGTQANTMPAGSLVRIQPGGTIFLPNALNYAADIQLNGGATGEALGNLRVENGTVTGPVSLLATSTVGTNGATGFISGVISGGFGLTKVGAGNITLTGNNTYTGTTTISVGTLQLGNGVAADNIIPAANLIANNSALIYNTPSDITHSGIISGTGTFTKQGTGTLELTATNTYTGATTITDGILKIGTGVLGNAAYAGAVSIAVGKTFHYASDSGQSMSGIISGAGAIKKEGTGTLTLTGANTYTGALDINEGSIFATSAASLGAVPGAINFDGGNLTTSVGSDATFPRPVNWKENATWIFSQPDFGRTWIITGNWSVDAGKVASIDGAKTTGLLNINGIISGDGGVLYSGGLPKTVAGNNTYTGGTTVSSGTITLDHINACGTGTITLADANTGANSTQVKLNALGTFLNGFTVGDFPSANNTILGWARNWSQTGTITVPVGRSVKLQVQDTDGTDHWYHFGGILTGGGTVNLLSDNTPTANRLFIGNVASDFSGQVNLVQGRTQVNDRNAFGTGLADLNTGAAGTTDLRMWGASAYTLPIDALTGSGQIYNDNGGNTVTISLGNNNEANAVHSGTIGPAGNALINLIKNGNGTQTIGNATTAYTGTTTVNNGVLVVNAAGGGVFNSPVTVNNGSTFRFTNTVASGQGASHSITLADTGIYENSSNFWTVITNPARFTVGGAATTSTINLTGAGGVNRGLFLDGGLFGGGTLTINAGVAGNSVNFRNNNGNATFNGLMIVNGVANWQASLGSGLSTSGCTTCLSNTDIQLNGTLEMGNAGLGWASNMANPTTIIRDLTGNGVITCNHGTAGTTARITLGSANDASYTGEIVNGTNCTTGITKVGTGTQSLLGSVTSPNGIAINAGRLEIGGAGNHNTGAGVFSGVGSLLKSGAGTLTSSGVNTISGGIEISGGTFTSNNTGNTATSNMGTGTITIRTGATLNCITGDNCLGHTAAANIPNVDIDGGTFTASPPAGTGLWFDQINFLDGGTVNGVNGINAQAAFASQINVTASANAATISTRITASGAFTFTVNNGAADPDLTVSGVISGAGAITKAGAGTLTLSGNNTNSGGIAMQGGTLRAGHINGFGTGTVTCSAPCTAGTCTVNRGGFATPNIITTNGLCTVVD